MAATDLTIVESRFPARDRLNSRVVREVHVVGPVQYQAGGIPNLPAALGLSEIYGVYGILYCTALLGVCLPWWNSTTQRLLFMYGTTGNEVPDGDNLSTERGTLLITGKG